MWPACWSYACYGSLPLDLSIFSCILYFYVYMLVKPMKFSLSLSVERICCFFGKSIASHHFYLWQADIICTLVHYDVRELLERLVYESCRLLPESVVWLCANNRSAEAEKIIRNAAKLNKITMPDKILAQQDDTVDGDGENVGDGERKTGRKLLDKLRNLKKSKKSEKTDDSAARYTLLDIFRNRHLTINTLCMSFLWSVLIIEIYTYRRCDLNVLYRDIF